MTNNTASCSFPGLHRVQARGVVRLFQPRAPHLTIPRAGDGMARLRHDVGAFAGPVPGDGPHAHQLCLHVGGTQIIVPDLHSFGSMLGELEFNLHTEGTHPRDYERTGSSAIFPKVGLYAFHTRGPRRVASLALGLPHGPWYYHHDTAREETAPDGVQA